MKASHVIFTLFVLTLTTTIGIQGQPITGPQGNVVIGGVAPDPSAILDLQSTTKGFLMPRMTSAQRNTIANPAVGLMVFNTDSNAIQINTGTITAPIWEQTLTDSTIGGFAWQLGGNSGTTAGTNFIGTNDSVAFEIHVNNDSTNGRDGYGRAMRIEPTSSSPNIIAGFQGNNVGTGVTGATISGGGSSNTANTVNANYGTIGGGDDNGISNGAFYATIAGGYRNVVDVERATIAGGFKNFNAGYSGTIGGGASNEVGSQTAMSTLSGWASTVSGGERNKAIGSYSAIGGGSENSTSEKSEYATIGGGFRNQINFEARSPTIGGGSRNEMSVSASYSTISGGRSNKISTSYSTIAGGRGLSLSGKGSFGFLGGNSDSSVQYSGNHYMHIIDSNVAVFGNTDLWLANNDTNARQIRFYEANNSAGEFPPDTTVLFAPTPVYYTSFEAGDQAADINYILPLSTTATTTVEDGVLQLDNTTGQLSWVDPAELGSGGNGGGNSGWKLTGNAGTTPGTNFLGTTDNQAFEIHVDNANTTGTDGRGQAMRIEPNGTSPNIIAGYQGNSINTGVVGATISGGGASGNINAILANNGTIGGGTGNVIDGVSAYATIGGGSGNGTEQAFTTIGGGSQTTQKHSTEQSAVDSVTVF